MIFSLFPPSCTFSSGLPDMMRRRRSILSACHQALLGCNPCRLSILPKPLHSYTRMNARVGLESCYSKNPKWEGRQQEACEYNTQTSLTITTSTREQHSTPHSQRGIIDIVHDNLWGWVQESSIQMNYPHISCEEALPTVGRILLILAIPWTEG